MAIEIKEYVGFTSLRSNKNNNYVNLTESAALAAPQQLISPDSLMVEIEGIHANTLTINDTMYSSACLKKSIPYWTSPYERPVIMHHNEDDGQIVGRVKSAEIIDSKRSGTEAIKFTCNIGDEAGIKGVKNGTLSTVSIGAMAFDARCSICGNNVAECDCGHEKGEIYNGKLCYWIIEDMVPKEISYVIVPSDKYALTMKVYKPGKKDLKESVEVKKKMSVCEEIMKNLTESVIDDGVKEDGLSVKEKVHVDEEVKASEEDKKTVETDVEDKEKTAKVEEKPEQADEENEEKLPEDESKEDDKSKKSEENEEKSKDDENKEEDESNKDDERDELIKSLQQEVADLKEELKGVKAQLKTTRDLKESVDKELAKFKVQEKVEVARKIKNLKESVGVACEEAEEMAKNYSIKELNLIHETLSATCNYTKLPEKLVMESVINEETDNVSKKYKNVTESANNNTEEEYKDIVELQNLHKRLFK